MKTTIAIVVSLLLGGCASSGNRWKNTEAVNLSHSEAVRVANDLAHVIAVEYPPASTALAMSDNKTGKLGEALENELRARGYALAVQGKNQPDYSVNIAYVIDEMFKGAYRVGITASPAWRLDKLYKRHPSGVLVASGTNIRNGTRKAATVALKPEIVPEKAKPLNAKKKKTGGWSVQVMAGTNMVDLHMHRYQLYKGKLPAEIVPYNRGNWHSLRIGPYKTLSEARPVLMDIRERYNDAFLVVPKGEQS